MSISVRRFTASRCGAERARLRVAELLEGGKTRASKQSNGPSRVLKVSAPVEMTDDGPLDLLSGNAVLNGIPVEVGPA